MRIIPVLSAFFIAATLASPMPAAAAETAVEPRIEKHDAMAEGTSGTSEGTIASLDKGKLVLQTAEGALLLMPHWRGGAPKDGGGLDKAMLETLAAFKPGDRVLIAWTWSERRRIERIQRVEAPKR